MAPSRRKKVLRDSIVTRAFFNQGDSGSCSCGIALSHNHATTSLNTGDPDHSKLADPGRGDEILEDEISSIWIPNFLKLSPQAQQAAYAASTMQPPVSESTQVLKLAYKQMSDDPAKADQFNSMDTFDLNNLHGVAKGYDKLSKTYKDKEESEMADLAGLVGDLAVTASDAKRTSDDRLAAELDMQNLNIYSKITVPLNSCLRQVQLFNIEKRFGFVEEEYQALCNNDKKQHGEDVPAQLPLSFRQQLENPFKPPEPTSESSKKEDKKKLSGLDALVELQRNFKLVTEEFQDLKKIVSDAEKPIELPGLPASFTYRNVPVPEDIPNHIRQRFFDVDFAHQEVVLLRQQASNQILCVKSGIAIWYNTSHEVWEYCKTHVHEMPLFRDYENTRTSLHALLCVASQQEVKIFEFYSSEGAPELPQAMDEAFKLGSLSLEEFKKEWEKRLHKAEASFPSVDKLIAAREQVLKTTAE